MAWLDLFFSVVLCSISPPHNHDPSAYLRALLHTTHHPFSPLSSQVMVDPSDLEALLGGGGDDDDDGEGLQHHAGADKALGALLGLKKSGRKKGALEAQRQGYQIRLRALDLLEVSEDDRRNVFRYHLVQLAAGVFGERWATLPVRSRTAVVVRYRCRQREGLCPSNQPEVGGHASVVSAHVL